MLLYITLYIMLAYLMLVASLSKAVCLSNDFLKSSFFAIDICKLFLLSCLVLASWHIACLFQV